MVNALLDGPGKMGKSSTGSFSVSRRQTHQKRQEGPEWGEKKQPPSDTWIERKGKSPAGTVTALNLKNIKGASP